MKKHFLISLVLLSSCSTAPARVPDAVGTTEIGEYEIYNVTSADADYDFVVELRFDEIPPKSKYEAALHEILATQCVGLGYTGIYRTLSQSSSRMATAGNVFVAVPTRIGTLYSKGSCEVHGGKTVRRSELVGSEF